MAAKIGENTEPRSPYHSRADRTSPVIHRRNRGPLRDRNRAWALGVYTVRERRRAQLHRNTPMTHVVRLAPWFVATLLAAGCVEDRCRAVACSADGDASVDAASSDASPIIAPDASVGEDAVVADSERSDASESHDGSLRADAAVGSDASSGFVLLPTDEVVAYAPQAVAARLSVTCMRLGVVRSGGTLVVPEDAVTSITTSTTDGAIAQPAPREDCPGVGAIALAAGQATVEADVVVQSRTFHVRYALRVLAERIAVYADSLLTGTMHVDEPRAFTVSSLAAAGATSGSMKASWLRVASSGPAIAVERIVGHRWRATGRMLGDATISATYGPPGMEQTYTAPAPLSVVAPGALLRVEEVLFRGATDDFTAQFQLQPAQCADLAVRAWYRLPTGVMYPAVTTMATFTAEGATRIESAATTRVCADARGQSTIRGCIGGACRQRDEFVSSPGARLELSPAAITATRIDASSSRACVALRGAVVFADGARIDLTLPQLTRSIALSEAMAPFRSVVHTVEAGMGDEFCFRAQTAAAQYVFQAQAYQFAARIPVTVR
jgi:hypothetical protein